MSFLPFAIDGELNGPGHVVGSCAALTAAALSACSSFGLVFDPAAVAAEAEPAETRTMSRIVRTVLKTGMRTPFLPLDVVSSVDNWPLGDPRVYAGRDCLVNGGGSATFFARQR